MSTDLERLLSEPVYAIDFQVMAGDLKDFLDSSESNIERQHIEENERIRREVETDDTLAEDLRTGYVDHLLANADHRFKVSLPLRVRYAALVGLMTSVEWSVQVLKDGLGLEPKLPKGRNPTVHVLQGLNDRTDLGRQDVVKDYEALVRVRNCVVHSAGLLRHYEHREELPSSIERLRGFSIGNWLFLGDHICIERDALNQYIDSCCDLVVALYRACHERHLFGGVRS